MRKEKGAYKNYHKNLFKLQEYLILLRIHVSKRLRKRLQVKNCKSGELNLQKYQEEKKRITIKEVAQAAGVSIATVSRILNGQGGVSPVLVEQVETAVKELNYQPNSVARALKIRESKSIGLLIPDIENPFFPALVRGVEDAAQSSGYALILCNTDGKQAAEEKYIQFLLSKQIDGIIFTGNLTYSEWKKWLPIINVPVVLLDRKVDNTPFSTVMADNQLGAFMAVEHLIQQQYKKIALLSGRALSLNNMDRVNGYREALKKHGFDQDAQPMAEGQFTFEGGYQAVDQLFAQGGEFDAIFACNDMMAIGAIERLTELGRRVPEDIAVVGFDNIRMAAWYKPSLTTVDQPVYEMGKMAAQLLMEHISGIRKEAAQVVIKPELVVRQSSQGKAE